MRRLIVPLAAAAVVAVTAAAAVAQPSHHHAAAATPSKQVALQLGMRALWEDHIVWTRQVIVAVVAGSPDTSAALNRLLRNQDDIGRAVASYYGKAAGTKLATLLRGHILIAGDILGDAKGDNGAKLKTDVARWNANADEIAAFLASANPHWKRGELRAMLRHHLTLTLAEATARLQGKWAADVRSYDAVHRHALEMADALTAGIVAQFPARFS